MTSTNDGKDVKSNQSSGQKGKTYYIELYKTLDGRLSGEGDVRERTRHLCETWRRVHSICQHSASTTNLHLLSWLQKHTAQVILQTEWQSPSCKDAHTSLESAINDLIEDCKAAKASRDGVSPPWEQQLQQRAEWFKKNLENPWGHPVLRVLLDPRGQRPTDDEILKWLKDERGMMFVTRLRQLATSKCDDLAMALVTAVMDRARATNPLLVDNDQPEREDKPTASKEGEPTFVDILKNEADFTTDVWDLLTDIEFVLLHKSDRVSKCIELAKQTPLSNGYQLVDRLQARLETLPREKKLWKNAKEVAILIAQVMIARCMLVPVCVGTASRALYSCARALSRLLPSTRLPAAAATLAAPAATARHLHMLATAVDAQCSADMKPFVCELYVRAITAGMNELERFKLTTEKETEARSMEKTLCMWFTQLGALLSASNRIKCECTLTAFSVHPSPAMYEKIKSAPTLPPVAVPDDADTKHESTSEFGSWATDSHTHSNLVKTSETLNIKHTQNQANVLSTAILTEGEGLGLSPELCQDIAVLLSGPRVKTLSWDMDRALLIENCRTYMERTHGGTKALTTELKYLNLDPSSYEHLPIEDEDETDVYYGIEKGYEHLVELQEQEEVLWPTTIFDPEMTESCSSGLEYEFGKVSRKKKHKKIVISTDEEERDPLGTVAENKKKEVKKERPHSKERSSKERKERKKKTKSAEGTEENKERSRERRKSPEALVKTEATDKEKKKEKKPRKKKTKEEKEQVPVDPKPGSLSSLIGMKVAKIKIPEGEYKKTTETNVKPSITDSDYDSQGKSSLASLNSEGNDPDVLFDGLFSMDDYKSPEKNDPPSKRNSFSSGEVSFSNGQVSVHSQYPYNQYDIKPNIQSLPQNPQVSPSQTLGSNANRGSAESVREEVKKSLSKLLEFRRQKILLNESHKALNSSTSSQNSATHKTPNTSNSRLTGSIVQQALPDQTITHPKTEYSDRHNVYMNKKQVEQLNDLKTEVDNYLKSKFSPKPVIQYASKHNDNNTHQNSTAVTRHEHVQPPTYQDANTARTIQHTNIAGVNYTHQSTKPVNQNQQKNFQDFLRELQETINAGTGTNGEQPSKTTAKRNKCEIKPISRVTPVIPSSTKKEPSSQCAKTLPGKKVDTQLNTFSRLSYMHKNKQNTELVIGQYDQNVINRYIEEQRLAKSKHVQSKGERMLMQSKGEVVATKFNTAFNTTNNDSQHSVIHKTEKPSSLVLGHSVLASLIQKQDSTSRQMNNTDLFKYQTPAPERVKESSKTFTKNSALSDRDQNDLLLLLRQQSKLNTHVPTVTKTDNYIVNNIVSNPQCSKLNTEYTSTSNKPKKSVNSSLNKNHPVETYGNKSNNSVSKYEDSSKAKSTFTSTANKSLTTFKNHPADTCVKTSHNKYEGCKIKTMYDVPKEAYTKIVDCKTSKVKTILNKVVNVTPNFTSPTNSLHQFNEQPSINKSNVTSNTTQTLGTNPQDWEKVMDAILSHKTPSRGPNALDMVLKKNSFSDLRNQRIVRPGTTATVSNVPKEQKTTPVLENQGSSVVKTPTPVQHANLNLTSVQHLQKPSEISIKASSVAPSREVIKNVQNSSKTEHMLTQKIRIVTKTQNAPSISQSSKVVDMPHKQRGHSKIVPQPFLQSAKVEASSIQGAKKSTSDERNKRVAQDSSRKQCTKGLLKEKDPFISGIQNSDYDLLEELMDDELRKEIGELSSDEDVYHSPIAGSVKVTKTMSVNNKSNVIKGQLPHEKIPTASQSSRDTIIKSNQTHVLKSHNSKPENTTKPSTSTSNLTNAGDSKPKVIGANTVICPSNISHQPISTNVTPLLNTEPPPLVPTNSVNMVEASNVIIAAVPQPPIQNVVLIGSDIVFDPYLSMQTQIQSGLCKVNQGPAYGAFRNVPNITVYQTTQFAAPVVNPVIIGNAMTMPISNMSPKLEKSSNSDNDKLKQSSFDSQMHNTLHLNKQQEPESLNICKKEQLSNGSKQDTVVKLKNLEQINDLTNKVREAEDINFYDGLNVDKFKGQRSKTATDQLVNGLNLEMPKITNNRGGQLKEDVKQESQKTVENSSYPQVNEEFKQKVPTEDKDMSNQLKQQEAKVLDINLNKSCERKVLSEVQEKQKIIDKTNNLKGKNKEIMIFNNLKEKQKEIECVTSEIKNHKESKLEKENAKNLERLHNKRLAIMNREITHHSNYPPIPLSYMPLTRNNPNTAVLTTETQQSGGITMKRKINEETVVNNENSFYIGGRHQTNKHKESNNNTQCRRILLRSSNELKANIDSSLKAEGVPVKEDTSKGIKIKIKINKGPTKEDIPVDHFIVQGDSTKQESKQLKRVSKKGHNTHVKTKKKAKTVSTVSKECKKQKKTKSLDKKDNSITDMVNVEEISLASSIPKTNNIHIESQIVPVETSISKDDTKNEEKINEELNTVKSKDVDVQDLDKNVTQLKQTKNANITSNTKNTNTMLFEKQKIRHSNRRHTTRNSSNNMGLEINSLDSLPEKSLTKESTLKHSDAMSEEKHFPGQKINSLNTHNTTDIETIAHPPLNAETSLQQKPSQLILNKPRTNNKQSQSQSEKQSNTDVIKTKTSQLPKLNNNPEITKPPVTSIPQPSLEVDNSQPNVNVPGENIELMSLEKDVKIEELPSSDEEPDKKRLRIILPNGKVFKATVFGQMHVSFQSLFSDPSLKMALMNNLCEKKRYTLNVKQISTMARHDPKKVFHSRIEEISFQEKSAPKPVETVNLLSDDEDVPDHKNKHIFKTEFGMFNASMVDAKIYELHQKKFDLKSVVMLNTIDIPSNSATEVKSNETNSLKNDVIVDCEKISESAHECQATCKSVQPLQKNGEIPFVLSNDVPLHLNTIVNESRITCKSPIVSKDHSELTPPVLNNENEVIEIDDSSNDSVNLLDNYDSMPELQNIVNISTALSSDVKDIAPEGKIIELKNLLLQDLGVKDVKNSVDNIPLKPINEETVGHINEQVPCENECYVNLIRCDDVVKKYEHLKILKRKCTVDLFRCDHMVKEANEILTDELKLINSDSDEIIDIGSEGSNLPTPSELSRWNSFSLLNDFPFYTGETSNECLSINASYDDDRTSPVIDVYDTIAAFKNCYRTIPENENLTRTCNINCYGEWFKTKHEMHIDSKTYYSTYDTEAKNSSSYIIDNIKLPSLKTLSANVFKHDNTVLDRYVNFKKTITSSPFHRLKRKIKSIETNNIINNNSSKNLNIKINTKTCNSNEAPGFNEGKGENCTVANSDHILTGQQVFNYYEVKREIQNKNPNSNATLLIIKQKPTEVSDKIDFYDNTDNAHQSITHTDGFIDHLVDTKHVTVYPRSQKENINENLENFATEAIGNYTSDANKDYNSLCESVKLDVVDEMTCNADGCDVATEAISNFTSDNNKPDSNSLTESVKHKIASTSLKADTYGIPNETIGNVTSDMTKEHCNYLRESINLEDDNEISCNAYLVATKTIGNIEENITIAETHKNLNESVNLEPLNKIHRNSDTKDVDKTRLIEIETTETTAFHFGPIPDTVAPTDDTNSTITDNTNIDKSETTIINNNTNITIENNILTSHIDRKKNHVEKEFSSENNNVDACDNIYELKAISVELENRTKKDKKSSSADSNESNQLTAKIESIKNQHKNGYNGVNKCDRVGTCQKQDSANDGGKLQNNLNSSVHLPIDKQYSILNNDKIYYDDNIIEIEIDDRTLKKEGDVNADNLLKESKFISEYICAEHEHDSDVENINEYEVALNIATSKMFDHIYVLKNENDETISNENNRQNLSNNLNELGNTTLQYQDAMVDIQTKSKEIVSESVQISTKSHLRKEVTLVYKDGTDIILKGIEYEDPVVGTCYVFPINKETKEDEYEELSEDREQANARNFLVNLEETESILHVNIPKVTYSRYINTQLKQLKRKRGMHDVKILQKKYRKGKNIDYSKLTITASTNSGYFKEYKLLLDYFSSLKFSFSQSFHRENIDVDEIIKNWPITANSNILLSEIECEHILFQDNEQKETSVNPLDLSFIEEINETYNEPKELFDNVNETNFNMGFGEGSDRVKQNLENKDDISKVSAATLSDVKQPQPFLLSENYERITENITIKQDELNKMKQYLSLIQLKDKVRSFFKQTTIELSYDAMKKEKDDFYSKHRKNNFTNDPFELCRPDFIKPAPIEAVVQVVQVGQLPVSAAAQNPVTCDPRVTQVSDVSPSQCSVDNSPQDDSQVTIKTEYTELTTADLTLPLQEYAHHNQSISVESQDPSNLPLSSENIPIETEIKSVVKIELMEELPEVKEETRENFEHNEYDRAENKPSINTEYTYDTTNSTVTNTTNATILQPDTDFQTIYDSTEKQSENDTYTPHKQQNGSPEKTDQIAHAMNAAGITTTAETITNTNRAHALVNILSQKLRQGAIGTSQSVSNSFTKTTAINAMALQQALAQILPPPLNQTNSSENNQQTSTQVTPQVLHIVQGKNASGSQITLVDNSSQSVISNQNATPVLHIVQNKTGASVATSNGTATSQANTFSGLSLVDTGLQQGGNQLLHIVNTGNQKNSNATGQLLKRVNLLTNLTNVQGSNEQKMVQFVCKSADGKSIQLNAPHQRSMVLRLQPIESPNVNIQTTPPKPAENQDMSPQANTSNSSPSKDNTPSQHEIKSRSVYEENYAKFIQNSSNKTSISEKSTSLPKFNQAFGKPVFQEGNQKQNEISVNNGSEGECQSSDNAINIDHIGQISSPPLLLRKSPQTSQSQTNNLVQQLKQTIAPMNIQTMHGGVIYTRQIPVNIGGGQTINLITVPSTELIDESGQKQPGNQTDIEQSIIKIVPQTQTNSHTEISQEDGNSQISGSNETSTSQPQPVLTQMRIKLPMLSKNPQMVAGARVVRPSFFQIQRNVIGGANQPVYQQLVLTAAPPLGQQTIRLPQTQTTRQIKVPTENQSSTESQMSSSTLEQLREFDMVLEQVKERSTVQPSSSTATFPKLHTPSNDTTDGGTVGSSSSTETTQQVLYSIGNSQPLNVAYVNRKSTVTTPTTSTFVRSPDSSGIIDSPTSTNHTQIPHTVTSETTQSEPATQSKPVKVSSKSKSRPKASSNPPNNLKLNTVPPKTSTQKPLEDEQTTQRILYILAEYKEQVENSPDKDKPAPRRRSNPPSNPSGSSKRKKSSSSSRRPGVRDLSPIHGEDTCRTMGSEDSSCGTSQGDCNESCLESHSPQDSPRKVVRKLTFEQEAPTPQPRPQPQRNVIVADGQTITVARGTAGKPTTAVLMPANYILPVSMVKGGQQIAIVTNRGPKLLTVGGEGGATNALLLQRLIGPAGLKPVLTRPGVRHVRLPTAALHNLQAFNLATATTIQPPDSTASPAPGPTPPELIDTRATSSPWTDREAQDVKPERASSPEGSEPWHLPSSGDPHDYSYEETVRADNLDRTVLVVQKKDGSSHRQHRLTHVSAAALRHKYAILEHELRLQKSLSEECEDLGVDSPSASELFPEAELLFAASPAHDHTQDQGHHSHTPQPTLLSQSGIPQPDIDDQIATDQLLTRDMSDHQQDLNLGLEDVGIVTVSEDGMQATIALDQEEFARSHPNTTFHSEPTDEGEVQPFTIAGLKGRHITSTIFHSNRAPATVLMTTPQTTVISQATPESCGHSAVKYSDIDNMINSLPSGNTNNINLSSVLVKDQGLTRFDNILSDSRELHLSHTASAIVHSAGNATQVIRRVCYDDDKRDTRFLMDEPDALIAGDDAKMIAEDSSRDATMESMAEDVDDDRSSPERHAELFWESNSASERSESRRPLDFSSDSEKCCKSPSYDETNSTDSSGVGTNMRLDSVIKDARGMERSGSADGSSADDTHPPLRTYPPKRLYHPLESDMERSLSGKTRAGERSPDSLEVRRRASGRGVVKRGCHCCNGSPAPPRPKKSRQRKPTMDFTTN